MIIGLVSCEYKQKAFVCGDWYPKCRPELRIVNDDTNSLYGENRVRIDDF